MSSINQAIIVGNLGRDPEIRYTQAGDAIANFTVATNERWTSKSGEKQERTEWHRIEVFGRSASFVSDYLHKGDLVFVQGQIRYEEWLDKEGNKRFTTRIRVSGPNSTVQKLSGRSDSADAPAPAAGGDDDAPPF